MAYYIPIELEFNLEDGISLSEIESISKNAQIGQTAIDDFYSYKMSEDDLIAHLEYLDIDWQNLAIVAQNNLVQKYGIKN